MSASSKHDDLARDFVFKVASQTQSCGEMMVVIESALLASMLVLRMREKMQPRHAALHLPSDDGGEHG